MYNTFNISLSEHIALYSDSNIARAHKLIGRKLCHVFSKLAFIGCSSPGERQHFVAIKGLIVYVCEWKLKYLMGNDQEDEVRELSHIFCDRDLEFHWSHVET